MNMECEVICYRTTQHYVIKFVSDLRQFSGFLRILQFPPSIKLTTMTITGKLLKVALNTINHKPILNKIWWLKYWYIFLLATQILFLTFNQNIKSFSLLYLITKMNFSNHWDYHLLILKSSFLKVRNCWNYHLFLFKVKYSRSLKCSILLTCLFVNKEIIATFNDYQFYQLSTQDWKFTQTILTEVTKYRTHVTQMGDKSSYEMKAT